MRYNHQIHRYHRIQHHTLEPRVKNSDKSTLISIPVAEPEVHNQVQSVLHENSWKGELLPSHNLQLSKSKLQNEDFHSFYPDKLSRNNEDMPIRKKSAECQRERPYLTAMVRRPQCGLSQRVASQAMEFPPMNYSHDHCSTETRCSVQNKTLRSGRQRKTLRNFVPIAKLLHRHKHTPGPRIKKRYSILYAQGQGAVQECNEGPVIGCKFRAANLRMPLHQQLQHIGYSRESSRHSTIKKDTAFQAYTLQDKTNPPKASFTTNSQRENDCLYSLDIFHINQKEGESSSKKFGVDWTYVKSGMNETENLTDMKKKINSFFQNIRHINPSYK